MMRSIHGITWKDDLAWMEDMKGTQWKKTIEKAQQRWKDESKGLDETAKLFAAESTAASYVAHLPMFQGNLIQIASVGTTFLHWCWEGQTDKIHAAADVETCKRLPGFVWAIETVEEAKGAEVYQLACYVKEKEAPVWTVRAKDSFAPKVLVLQGRVYVLESKNRLIYNTIVSFDALTGKDRKVLYEEKDEIYNLSLERCSCEIAYMIRSTGPKQDLFFIDGKTQSASLFDGISLESRRFILSDKPFAFFTWTAKDGWKASKELLNMFEFPSKAELENPESILCKRNILVTKAKGERTIWRVSKYKKPEVLWQGIGNVVADSWDGPWFCIQQPGCEAIWWNCERDEKPIENTFTQNIQILDLKPSPLRCVIVCDIKKPTGLLVIGYGAYGMSTKLNTYRWQPLLHRGWAICFGLFRGGGDDSPAWEDAGRLGGRQAVLADAEEVVRLAQKATGCGPESTWLYGRSAGGLWVGGLVASLGREICSGAYMEVPYLDVLQTTTNATLPLTLLEADEFGYPLKRISDLEGILRWSPMELVRNDNGAKAKEVKQIVRTGLHDKEVYAYESVKWTTRCGPRSLLAVEEDQGHFVGGSTAFEQQGMDLAMLMKLFVSS